MEKILGIRADQFIGWLIVGGLITIFIILGLSGIDFMKVMIDVNNWFYEELGEVGVYLATMGISIFGNFTVLLPIPYILSIITILLILPVNPYLLGLFAAIGASIGELSAWLLGRGAAEVVSGEFYEKKIKGLEELIKKGYGFWLVLLFAATPLPDDVLLIALGMQKFSLKTSLVASIIGKYLQVMLLFLIVFIFKNTLYGQIGLYLFGINIKDGVVSSAGDTIVSTITWLVTIGITLLIIMVDWNKLFRKWKKRLKKEKA